MTLQKLPVTSLNDEQMRRRHREVTNLVLTHQHDDSRVRTAAEVSAGVTPVNYAYQPGDVRRYGAVGDNVANDSPAFQAAINVAKVRGLTVLLPQPTESYRLATPLDLTAPVGSVTCGFTVRGEANVNTAVTGFPATITIDHSGHGFDCTGALGVIFENFSVATAQTATTAFLLARNTDERSQIVRFRHIAIRGAFSEPAIYNYGSEDDQYDGCFVFNTGGGTNSHAICFTAHNVRSLSSTFTTIATGQQSTIDHKIFGGEWAAITTNTNGCVVFLDNISSLKIFGPWMLCGSESAGSSPIGLIRTTGANGASSLVTLIGITGEHSTTIQSYGVVFTGGTATHSYWTIESCTFPNVTAAIYADTGHTCDNFHIKAISNQSVGGGMSFQTLENSHIDELSLAVSIVTDADNVLNVNTTALTITNRGGGTSICGSGTDTWTPGIGAVTTAGPGAVSNTTVHYHGRQVTVTAIWTGYTTFTIAAGGAITGLPVASFVGSGVATFIDLTNDALIGVGNVSGTSIITPNIVAGANQVALTATYFVS
jgi:hypothetical protein